MTTGTTNDAHFIEEVQYVYVYVWTVKKSVSIYLYLMIGLFNQYSTFIGWNKATVAVEMYTSADVMYYLISEFKLARFKFQQPIYQLNTNGVGDLMETSKYSCS